MLSKLSSKEFEKISFFADKAVSVTEQALGRRAFSKPPTIAEQNILKGKPQVVVPLSLKRKKYI